MNKHKTPFLHLLKNNKKRTFIGFTLVELIVVIVILAILATIAFFSFNSYSSSSRDSTRLADLSQTNKGIELYYVNAGYYPLPNGNITTGKINGVDVSYNGNIGDQIAKSINLNKTPKDPISDNYIGYGLIYDKSKYQLAVVLENPKNVGNIDSEFNKVYASDNYEARVIGNYQGNVKFSTGTSSKLYYLSNMPSLIFSNSGTNNNNIDLLSGDSVFYIVNGNSNLPYSINNSLTKSKNGDVLIKEITSFSGANLVAVDITSIVTESDKTAQQNSINNTFSGVFASNFAFNGNESNISSNSNQIIANISNTIINNGKSNNNTNTDTNSTPMPVLISGECSGLPTNGLFYNNSGSYHISDAPNGTSLIASGAITPENNTCQFKCKTNYTLSNNSCILNAPAAPATSSATSLTRTGATWNRQTSGLASYYEWSANGSVWINNSTNTSKSENTLSCGTAYTRYVRACNSNSVCSSVVNLTATTSACPTPQEICTTAGNYWTGTACLTVTQTMKDLGCTIGHVGAYRWGCVVIPKDNGGNYQWHSAGCSYGGCGNTNGICESWGGSYSGATETCRIDNATVTMKNSIGAGTANAAQKTCTTATSYYDFSTRTCKTAAQIKATCTAGEVGAYWWGCVWFSATSKRHSAGCSYGNCGQDNGICTSWGGTLHATEAYAKGCQLTNPTGQAMGCINNNRKKNSGGGC